jgi:hypothetical protein
MEDIYHVIGVLTRLEMSIKAYKLRKKGSFSESLKYQFLNPKLYHETRNNLCKKYNIPIKNDWN